MRKLTYGRKGYTKSKIPINGFEVKFSLRKDMKAYQFDFFMTRKQAEDAVQRMLKMSNGKGYYRITPKQVTICATCKRVVDYDEECLACEKLRADASEEYDEWHDLDADEKRHTNPERYADEEADRLELLRESEEDKRMGI